MGEMRLFFAMTALGAVIGVMFDFLRTVRQIFRLRGWMAAAVDLFYWLVATGAVFGTLLLGNGGELRFYVFLGLFFGAAAYFRYISHIVLRLMLYSARKVLRGVRLLLRLLFRLTIRPLLVCAGFVLRAARRGYQRLSRWFEPPDQPKPPPG